MIQPSVFISYKQGHEPTLALIRKIEEQIGDRVRILRDTTLEPGTKWSSDLYEWLMTCSAAIAIIGDDAAKSSWCQREWWVLSERNKSRGLPVFPVSVDATRNSARIFDHLQSIKTTKDADFLDFKAICSVEALSASPEDYLAAHHGWLRQQFEAAPMWGREPFALGDVYVETECGTLPWGKISRDKDPKDPFVDSEDTGGRASMTSTVMDLVIDPGHREPIIVQGPPGSGKSAFTLRIANRLLKDGFSPVVVRFRDFLMTQFDRADELISDAVRIGPVEDAPPAPKMPLLTPETLAHTVEINGREIRKHVLILDGWDEVSLTGNASYQAQLREWMPRFREFMERHHGPPLRLIMTGRPSAEVRASGVLKKETLVHTVRGLQPEHLSAFATDLKSRLDPHKDEDERWTIDLVRIGPMLEHYKSCFNEGWEESESRGLEILGSPLLAYLAFRTLADWDDDPEKILSAPTQLYKALIDTTVAHSGKGRQEEGIEGSVHRGGEGLRHLLHRVAGVISILGREAVSFKELKLRIEDDPVFLKWYGDGLADAVDTETADSALLELVVNFFFKGGHQGLGCEFLHKSFREYLFAEGIVAILLDLSDGKTGPLDGLALEYWQDFPADSVQYMASRRLAELLGPQWMTLDVRNHLLWLIERGIAEEPDRWVWIRDLLLDVYIWWAEGVPLRHQPERGRQGRTEWSPPFINDLMIDAMPFEEEIKKEPIRSTTLDAHMGEVLMDMTALVHARLIDRLEQADHEGKRRSDYRHVTDKSVRFAPGGDGFIDPLMARLTAAGWKSGLSVAKPFVLPAVGLRGADLNGADLNGADLSEADLSEADLRGADLSRADLSEVDLSRADLRGADLRRAHLSDVDLSEVDLRGADLSEADLRGADLSRANLSGAGLSAANLSGANLFRANLSGANLRRADLSGAGLFMSNLSGAVLSGANLSGANLSGAVLSGADLSVAGLSAANLSVAGLSGANLSGAGLSGANLSGANLSGIKCSRARIVSSRLHFTDLSRVEDLTQAQIDTALGNAETKLPDGLTRPAHWDD